MSIGRVGLGDGAAACRFRSQTYHTERARDKEFTALLPSAGTIRLTHIADPPSAKGRLDGVDLRSMFVSATALFERNYESINALNVYPVPDGDTGINMFLTLKSVLEAAEQVEGASAEDMAAAMARGAFMGAKGNSGVILSQFFEGMAVGLKGLADFGSVEMASAFREASLHAYKAVGNPVEGTLLTVIRSAADAAEAACGPDVSLSDFYEDVLVATRDSVARTPTLLGVLREAGVVDAGGQGLAVLIEGATRWVRGDGTEPVEVVPPRAIGVEGATGKISLEFFDAAGEEVYGYCTQYVVTGTDLDLETIRSELEQVASSTVVIGGGDAVKVHCHAEDPGPAISVGATRGTLAQVNVRNMDEQRDEFSQAGVKETVAMKVAVVAVALGNGFERLLRSLGAAEIVEGGDTMNPSVKDILDAVNAAPSDEVVVLPNNRNIIAAAELAAKTSDKQVEVVATRSLPEGVAAMVAFDTDSGAAGNATTMAAALEDVRTGEVTEAVRSVTINDVSVEPGQLIGLLDHQLVAAGDTIPEVADSVLESACVSDGDLITLYWGQPITEQDAQATMAFLEGEYHGAELELVQGGQPHYHLLISIE